MTLESRCSAERFLRGVVDAAVLWRNPVVGRLPGEVTVRLHHVPAEDPVRSVDPQDDAAVAAFERRLRDGGVDALLAVHDIGGPLIEVTVYTQQDASNLAHHFLTSFPVHAVAAVRLRMALGAAGIESEVRVAEPVPLWARCTDCRRLYPEDLGWCQHCLPPEVSMGVLAPREGARLLGYMANRLWLRHVHTADQLGPADLQHLAGAVAALLRQTLRQDVTVTPVPGPWDEGPEVGLLVEDRLTPAATDLLTEAVHDAEEPPAPPSPGNVGHRPLPAAAPPRRSTRTCPTAQQAARRLGQVLRSSGIAVEACAWGDGVKLAPFDVEEVTLLRNDLSAVGCRRANSFANAADPHAMQQLGAGFGEALEGVLGEPVSIAVVRMMTRCGARGPGIGVENILTTSQAERLATGIEEGRNARLPSPR